MQRIKSYEGKRTSFLTTFRLSKKGTPLVALQSSSSSGNEINLKVIKVDIEIISSIQLVHFTLFEL